MSTAMQMVVHQRILALVLFVFFSTSFAQQSHSSTTPTAHIQNEETPLLSIIDPALSNNTLDEDEADSADNELVGWKKPLAIGISFAAGTCSYLYAVSKCSNDTVCQYLGAIGRASLPATTVIIFSSAVLVAVSVFQHCVHRRTYQKNIANACDNIVLPPPPV